MARVWREGQKKKVWIYRLLTTGSIEEKVRVRLHVLCAVYCCTAVLRCMELFLYCHVLQAILQ